MSDVYFVSMKAGFNNSVIDNVGTLIKKMNFKKTIKENDTVAIKLHFGEMGNTAFLRPIYVKPFSDEIRNVCKAKPFITDTNTIYRGTRSDGITHLETALKNGFSYITTGAVTVIADGLNSEDYVDVEVNCPYFKKVKIAGQVHRAKALVVLTHFKGHELFGFGGAVKNIGMGLANKEGKLLLHSTTKPYVKKKGCVKCGVCMDWCPAVAIKMMENRAAIVVEKCTGCGQCIMSCPSNAITLKWNMDFSEGQEKTVEYAYGVVKEKKEKIWFFNFLMDITPECDCYGYSDLAIVPNIGIMASTDPVSIDQASYDMVKNARAISGSKADGSIEGEDKFKKCHPNVSPEAMFRYAEKIGLGERKYNLL